MFKRYVNKKIELFLGAMWNNFTDIEKVESDDVYLINMKGRDYFLRGEAKVKVDLNIRKKVKNLVKGDFILFDKNKIYIDDIKFIEEKMIFYDIFNKKSLGNFIGEGYVIKEKDGDFIYNFYIKNIDEYQVKKRWRYKKSVDYFEMSLDEIYEKVMIDANI